MSPPLIRSDPLPSSAPDREASGATTRVRAVRRRIASDGTWLILVGLVLLVGVAGQIRVWASDRGLWGDELYIAENLRELGFRALWGPLHYKQTAPPGWLMGEKAVLKVFGGDEQVLKVPELLASIAVLGLTAYVARRAIGRWGALAAVTFLVTSYPLYYYAGELKQYAMEAGLAMVIIVAVGVLGEAMLRGDAVIWRRALGVAAVCTLAVLGSYTAFIVLAGAVGGLGLLLALGRQWRRVGVVALVAVPGLSLGVFQVLLRKQFAFQTNQEGFFPNGLPPHGVGIGGLLAWLPRMWQGFVTSPLSWGAPWLIFALVVTGLVCLVWRGRRLWAAMIAGSWVVAIAQAAVHGLPIEDRVALYLLAPTVIAVAAGVDGIARISLFTIRQRAAVRRGVALAVAVTVIVLGTGAGLVLAVAPVAERAYGEVAQPRYRDDSRDMLREVSANFKPGDVVLAYYFSEAQVKWYGPGDGLTVAGLAMLVEAAKCSPAKVDRALAGYKRVWFVRGALFSRNPPDYADRVLVELAQRGTIVARSTQWKSSMWALVDLTAGPDPHPPSPTPDPALACLTLRRVPAPYWPRS